MEKLEKEVCQMLLERLGFDDLTVEEVDFGAPLFAAADPEGKGLGLDSVDSLEIVAGIRQNYGIRMTGSDMHVFESVNTIVEFVRGKVASKG